MMGNTTADSSMSQLPMSFASKGDQNPLGDRKKQSVQHEVNSAKNLNGDGYMTAIYNMMFLLQTRITKMLKGELMDEEIFRQYFIRLYRGISQMEQVFYECLEADEQETFVNYSNSLKDLASLFRVSRENEKQQTGGIRSRKRHKSEVTREKELISSLFGIGQAIPARKNTQVYCRVVPTKIVGFSRVEPEPEKPKDRKLRRRLANSDLAPDVVIDSGRKEIPTSPNMPVPQ